MDPYVCVVDKSVSYQVVKYILLMLNIMLVTTTAIIIVIVCLLPIVRTNGGANFEVQVINLARCMSLHDIDTIRVFRHAVLGTSAAIIINQSLAVYGLFRERPGLIMFSTILLGTLTQLAIFVLPTNVFLLLFVYILLSIVYVILLNRILETTTKGASRIGRAAAAPTMLEQQKPCGCRCVPTNSVYQPATIISPTRKPSLPGQYYHGGGAPYYYGSLGRRAREPRPVLSSVINRMSNDASLYGIQPQQSGVGGGLYGNFKHLNRNSNPSASMNNNNNNNNNNNATGEMFTTGSSGGQFATRLDSPGYNYINKTKQI